MRDAAFHLSVNSLSVSEAAFAEGIEAREWYTLASVRRGLEFERALDAAIQLILQFPQSGPAIDGSHRQARSNQCEAILFLVENAQPLYDARGREVV